MQVRCPHCQIAIELDEDSSWANLSCQSCGTQLDLVGEATVTNDDCTEISVTSPALPKQIGHFRLEGLLGSGGFGAVWKAYDLKLDRTVAIKFPRKERMTSGEVDHFYREARAAAKLQHRYIVSVHEVGRDDGFSYIVTDYIAGSTLSRWRQTRSLTPKQTARLCVKIAQALHHAHECGIIHRDVKPSNIMIDESGDPHVMDFGLAKQDSGDLSTMAIDGHAFGTPSFMSPEQARGEAQTADRRSDLYSLGVILFQLLTGELPFRGSPQIIVNQVVNDDPPHASSLNRNVPRDLDTICWKLMEKSPNRRYETGQDVADELERFLHGEPILARPITRTMRCWRWFLRNQMAGSLGIAFIVALLVGLIGITTQWIRAEQNSGAAKRSAQSALLAVQREKQARSDAEHYLYIARMNTAQQAFELRDLDRVQNILGAYDRPYDQGSDPRGFEWYYWARQSHQWRTRFDGHSAPVLAVDISKEGRWLLSASHDGTIRIWDATGAQAARVIQAHSGSVYTVALSPDGKHIATGGQDHAIRIWDFATGMPVRQWTAHDGTVFSLAYSPNGNSMVSSGSDTLVKQWDTATGELIRSFPGHKDFVYSVETSHDGRWIASCGLDRLVKLWDSQSGELLETFEGHLLEVWDVAFSPDDSTLASAGGDRTIILWDLETKTRSETLTGHSDRVRAVAFSLDGKSLFSVGHDRTVRMWDLTIEQSPPSVPFRNLNRNPTHFFERLSLPENKQSSWHVGHTGPITSIALGNDGGTIVTASNDLSIVSWQLDDFSLQREYQIHKGSINAAVYAPDGSFIATASNDHSVKLWDAETLTPLGEPFVHQERVFSVAISADQRRLATGTYDGTVTIWNINDHSKTELTGHDRGVSTVAFLSDGDKIVSAGHDGTIRIWDLEQQKPTLVMAKHKERVLQFAVYNDGKNLASAGQDRLIRLWDLSTGEQIHQLSGHDDTIWAMDIHGHMLATGGEDRAIRIWDLQSRRLQRTLRGHGDLVQSLRFSPDGQTLASGGGDKTIRLWDVQTGESKTTLEGHGYRVWSVDFAPDGRTLTSSSYHLRLWRGTTPEFDAQRE